MTQFHVFNNDMGGDGGREAFIMSSQKHFVLKVLDGICLWPSERFR
jgi:hypothetical protein